MQADLPADASERLALWLSLTAHGDRAAFRALYDATSARLLGIAFEVLGDRERAEEVLQDAYVKIWHHAERFDPAIARPMTWLMRIVRNRAIDVWRSRQGEGAATVALDDDIADQLVDPAPPPEQTLAWRHRERALARALGGLPNGLRLTASLALHGGLDTQQIAERCGVTPARARARLREAAVALRKRLAQDPAFG
jgi:RNA polymerase sigma-70 factor, ECF subfamily